MSPKTIQFNTYAVTGNPLTLALWLEKKKGALTYAQTQEIKQIAQDSQQDVDVRNAKVATQYTAYKIVEDKKEKQEKAERSFARFAKRLLTYQKKTNFRKAHESILTLDERIQYKHDNWARLAQNMLFEFYIHYIKNSLYDHRFRQYKLKNWARLAQNMLFEMNSERHEHEQGVQ